MYRGHIIAKDKMFMEMFHDEPHKLINIVVFNNLRLVDHFGLMDHVSYKHIDYLKNVVPSSFKVTRYIFKSFKFKFTVHMTINRKIITIFFL